MKVTYFATFFLSSGTGVTLPRSRRAEIRVTAMTLLLSAPPGTILLFSAAKSAEPCISMLPAAVGVVPPFSLAALCRSRSKKIFSFPLPLSK